MTLPHKILLSPKNVPPVPITCGQDLPPKSFLRPLYFVLPGGQLFIDKQIPEKFDKPHIFMENEEFPPKYFTDLHFYVASFGTYNHLGARIPIPHSRINVEKFREFLPKSFDDLVILQYLQCENYNLVPNLKIT